MAGQRAPQPRAVATRSPGAGRIRSSRWRGVALARWKLAGAVHWERDRRLRPQSARSAGVFSRPCERGDRTG